MLLRISLVLAILVRVAALAAPSPSSSLSFASPRAHLVRREGSLDVPRGWSLHRRADPDRHIELGIALAQSNLDNLESYLLDIADPASPNYGKHWTPERVAETFRPSQGSVDAVHSWLVRDVGIERERIRVGQGGGVLRLNVTVAEAERILEAEYYVYRHQEDGSERVGCHHGFHLPAHVSEYVDLVWPTVHLGGPRRSQMRGKRGIDTTPRRLIEVGDHKGFAMSASGLEGCDRSITLSCLRALYNFDYELVSTEKNSIAVVEILGQVYLQSDLDGFFNLYDPEQVGNHPTLVSIAGGQLNASAAPDQIGEATMDLQLVMGLLGRKQEVLLYQVSNETDPNTPAADELLAALDGSYCSSQGVNELGLTDCGNKPLATVISISYQNNVDLNDPALIPTLQRQCAEYGKLSLMGVTFVVSSGDEGVATGSSASGDLYCATKDNTLAPHNETRFGPLSFVPEFPASCPYVTSVGATQLRAGSSVHDPEIAAETLFYSGGGFSNVFSRPRWQDRAVKRYLKSYAPTYASGVFNRAGRGFPDVSANGFPTAVYINGGTLRTSGGTSASAPIFAALIAAINDARSATGKGPVGWINPAIYSTVFGSAFNDVTVGRNPGCGTDGFPAAPGWDPVTGLGTPNFERLLQRFLALP